MQSRECAIFVKKYCVTVYIMAKETGQEMCDDFVVYNVHLAVSDS